MVLIPDAAAESVVDYANACNQATKLVVPSFRCSDGIEIPNTGYAENTSKPVASPPKCDNPPYLIGTDCHAGSRIGLAAWNNDAIAVFLCRRKVHSITEWRNDHQDQPKGQYRQLKEFKRYTYGDNEYDDIALIQTNFANGATCFFQNQEVERNASGDMPATNAAQGNRWMDPGDFDRLNTCVRCHDTGLIRTPYIKAVAPVTGKPYADAMNAWLGVGNNGRVMGQYYWFPGVTMRAWNGKVLRVKSTKSTCTSCHPMGAATDEILNGNRDIKCGDHGCGTTAWLGFLSTGILATPNITKRPERKFHAKRAFWMPPSIKNLQADKYIRDIENGGATSAEVLSAQQNAYRLWLCATSSEDKRPEGCTVEPWPAPEGVLAGTTEVQRSPSAMSVAYLPEAVLPLISVTCDGEPLTLSGDASAPPGLASVSCAGALEIGPRPLP